jgi:hypothetical protein
VIRIDDRVQQLSTPLELIGKQAIADYLHDICQRDMTHRVEDEVVGANHLSFFLGEPLAIMRADLGCI